MNETVEARIARVREGASPDVRWLCALIDYMFEQTELRSVLVGTRMLEASEFDPIDPAAFPVTVDDLGPVEIP